MKLVFTLLLLLPLNGYSSDEFHINLCTRVDRYQLNIKKNVVQVLKNGDLLLRESYTDIRSIKGRELAEAIEAFRVYLHLDDIKSVIAGKNTTSGRSKSFTLGFSKDKQRVAMVLGENAEDLGFSWMCQ